MPEPSRTLFTVTEGDLFKCVPWTSSYVQFTVRSWHSGLRIGLFTQCNLTDPKYVIELGVGPEVDSKVAFYVDSIPSSLISVSKPFILDHREWRGFWIYLSNGTISFGKENECEPILCFKSGDVFKPIVKLGFKVLPHFHFYNREDRVAEADVVVDLPKKSQPSGVRWVKCCNGTTPENAFVGGHDSGNTLYVIRAMVRGALTPGKLRDGDPCCEVSWGGRAHNVALYEVLADFIGEWVECQKDNIPPLALLAGRSEDNYPLYVGRTSHQGTMTVGKVQPHYEVLFIPFQGQEISFGEYEILCHKPPGLPVIPHPLDDANLQQPTLKWIYSCNGRVPRNAFVIANDDDKAVILIRAKHKDIWYPGWMYCPDGIGHIAGRGFHTTVKEYEVLCNFKGYWEKPSDFDLPDNAVVMEDLTEKLYIGKARFKGKSVCGAVVDMMCEIADVSERTRTEDFEVLCHPNHVDSAVKNGLDNVTKWDV